MTKLEAEIENGWKRVLDKEFKSDYFLKLNEFIINEKEQHIIYPPAPLIYNAFNLTPFENVKVVILGQDPYHGPNQAHGLSFSVPVGVKLPPSLKNIIKELKSDIGITEPMHGNLSCWAKQGVLLINATLTVQAHEAGSHQKKGWETFTDSVIKAISDKKENVVFILWGNYAKNKVELIDESKHKILTSVHPSPLSARRGFLGCKHFSQTNSYLEAMNKASINWEII